MRIVKQLTENKFINIKEIQDPEKNVSGYQFAERKGINSIAFICVDRQSGRVLLNKELKPPVDSMILGAFGGSIDKEKPLINIVIDEVKEEAGFVVSKGDIEYVGKVLVSTQMNQYCYLYLVFVNKNEQAEREPENDVEKMSVISWHSMEELSELEDWKPIVIIEKLKNLPKYKDLKKL